MTSASTWRLTLGLAQGVQHLAAPLNVFLLGMDDETARWLVVNLASARCQMCVPLCGKSLHILRICPHARLAKSGARWHKFGERSRIVRLQTIDDKDVDSSRAGPMPKASAMVRKLTGFSTAAWTPLST